MSDQPDRDSRDVDLSAIGDTFKQLIGHMRGGIPVWEDFVARGVRFQKQMEQTILAFNSFLEGFSRIAELATHSKGSTREISSGLTNLVMWHKGQELKLREMNQAFMGKLLAPLQGKIEEWKKMTTYLDREHEKEVQKAAKEIKEVAKTTVKVSKNLESKLKKDKSWEKCSVLQQQLEQCQQETERRVRETEERERKNLSRVLVEERTWFCGFVNAFSWVLDIEVGMLGDLERLQAILKDLGPAVARPNQLPQTMQEFVETWVIPSSPVPRKRVSPHIPPSSHEITPPAAPPVPTLPPPPPGPPGPIPPPPNFHLPPPPPTFNPPPPTSTSLNPSFIAPMDPYNGYAPVGAMRPVPDEQFDPVALAMSISPSQASLMSNSSHQSTESSRSLSPPVGPTRSPAQPRAQLAAPQEDEPSSLQLEIMSRLRQRAQSLEGAQGPPESLPTISRTASLVVKPTSSSSMAVKPLTASPLLGGRRPPPVALKPARNSAGAEILTANGRQSPQLGYANPHHLLNPATLPPANGRQSPQLGYAHPHHPTSLPPANGRQSPQLGYAHHPTSLTSLPPANGRQSPQLGYAHPHHPTSLPPANGRQSPQLGYAHPHYSATLPPANRRHSPQLGYAHPHHILNPTSLTSRQDSSSDSEEEESAFAKALKQKKLRKAAQVSDRSGPNIGR